MKELNKKQKNLLVRVIIAAAAMVLFSVLPFRRWPVLRFALFMVPYLVVGGDVLKKAGKGILHRQLFDEHFLMAVATIGAMVVGEYTEAVAVMLFYQIGELFQSIAVGRSRQNIADLMDIRPDYANVEQDGELTQVDPDEVEVGTVIVVQPGEKVPIDGVVVEGSSTLNTSALTGESLPRDVGVGEDILSGSINLSGLLKVRTTREFDESTASKIIELVEDAGSRKAKSEQFITKFARVYTPAVVFGALSLAILGPLVNVLLGHAGTWALWSDWILRAMTFLVISCPCAIVVSIPLSFFGGIGGASAKGILIKGSNFVESLAKVQTVVFDKTGTITRGSFEVTGIHHSVMEEEKLIEYAALAESHSSHPIAQSLMKAYGKKADLDQVTDVQELSGRGVTATVQGHRVAVGNERLMREVGAESHPCSSIGTIVHVAVDGRYAGHIVISDQIKPHAAEAIRSLKKSGVRRTVMLTGDLQRVADQVGKEVGVDEIHAELLPADKVSMVEKYLGSGESGVLAFVGDGINDAPVLSRADVGIAMGALGSDAAIEAADVVLMDDDPLKISKAIRIARKCIRIVYENIVFAIGVKLLCLLLGALGVAGMWMAIFADVGVMILCVLNAIRCLHV